MRVPIKIEVKCPACRTSLMNSAVLTDNLPSIWVEAKVGGEQGYIYLSQVYGSYNKNFESVSDVENSIIELSCPFCHKPFPVYQSCDCKAPMIGLNLQSGGVIKICSRNGCKNHSLEFVDANDAFLFFKTQDKTGLI